MSKNLILIFFFSLLFFSGKLYSQKILGAVAAGMNLSQVDGDEIYGFKKAGFNLGPSAIIPFGKNKKWSISLELLFSQKGSYEKSGPSDTTGEPTPYYKLRLDYVEVPVIVHFKDKNIISGGLGFSYNQLVGVKEIEHGARTETNLRSPYSLADINVIADIQLRIYKRLWFDFRYNYSIFPIRLRHYKVAIPNGYHEWDRSQYNNLMSFRFIYIFNEEIPRAKGKTKKGN